MGIERRDFLKQSVKSVVAGVVASWIAPLDEVLAAPTRFLWYFEDWQGALIFAQYPDGLANPASVTKMATSLWALQEKGPSFRYATTFIPRGSMSLASRTLIGDMHLYASGDPDFHDENALLVAAALNRLGIDRIAGDLIIHGRFHMGWDDGRLPLNKSQWQRYLIQKGWLLRRAWNPARWSRSTRQAWARLQRSSKELMDLLTSFRGLIIRGGVRVRPAAPAPPSERAVIHYSNPLLRTLKRFNSYSNNDIERIGAQLGGPRALEEFLRAHVDALPPGMRFSSTSGLGRNRLSPRATVRILRKLIALGEEDGFQLHDVLPVAGVDEGTLEDRFADPIYAGSVVAKTGQLVRTDGGALALSGMAYTRRGPFLFAIFHRRTGRRLVTARRHVDRLLRRFIDQMNGPSPLNYHPTHFPLSYDRVRLEIRNERQEPMVWEWT